MAVDRRILLLPTPPVGYAGPVLTMTVAHPKSAKFEAAGSHVEGLLKKSVGIDDSASSAPSSPTTASPTSFARTWSSVTDKREKKAKTAKLTDDELKGDHYNVLGVAEFGFMASDEQIKNAYKRLVVETHPDKIKGGDDKKFKAVQKAYEILSDPLKKIAYDSSLDVDDDIPSSKVSEENFYAVFGECFALNARWSTNKPVPHLGVATTPMEEVDKFYDFWSTFKSWRDFSSVDEHNVEEADSREEKRWMERENDRERQKLARQETKRIQTLVERAKMNDPRIRAHKEMLKKKAEDDKQAAVLKKQKMAEDREQKAREKQEAEERRLAEEAAAKKQLAAIKRAMNRKVKVLLDQTFQPYITPQILTKLGEDTICAIDAEWCYGKMDFDMAQELRWSCEAIAASQEASLPTLPAACRNAVVAEFNKCITLAEQTGGRDRFGNLAFKPKAEEAPVAAAAVAAAAAEWTEAELQSLKDALEACAPGLASRWQKISQEVGSKDVSEVLAKARELAEDLTEATQEFLAAQNSEENGKAKATDSKPKPKPKGKKQQQARRR